MQATAATQVFTWNTPASVRNLSRASKKVRSSRRITCCTASEASPRTSGSAVKPEGTIVARAFTASAMPSRPSSAAKAMPLAPVRE